MRSGTLLRVGTAVLGRAMAAGAADARSLKWARTGDALTLDPHAQNEGPTHNLMHQIYEPLLIRDASGKVLPTLALSWAVTSDPTVWEFKLRQGVKFHNGNAFTADDVVFSLERARQPTSDMKGLLSSIENGKAGNLVELHYDGRFIDSLILEAVGEVSGHDLADAGARCIVSLGGEPKGNVAIG